MLAQCPSEQTSACSSSSQPAVPLSSQWVVSAKWVDETAAGLLRRRQSLPRGNNDNAPRLHQHKGERGRAKNWRSEGFPRVQTVRRARAVRQHQSGNDMPSLGHESSRSCMYVRLTMRRRMGIAALIRRSGTTVTSVTDWPGCQFPFQSISRGSARHLRVARRHLWTESS